MAEVSIVINSRAVHQMIDRAPQKVDRALHSGTEDSVTYALAIVRRYPTQRAGSTYVRTNTLMRSWSKRVTGRGINVQGIVGSNSNMAPYNRRVMDRDDQARIHRGRWETVQDISERIRPTVQGFYDARLAAEFR